MTSLDSSYKKGIAGTLLGILVVLLVVLCFPPLKTLTSHLEQQGEQQQSEIARNGVTEASNIPAGQNDGNNENYTFFDAEQLKDNRDKLSANHIHMRRIIRDLRDFLAAYIPSSLGGKGKKNSEVLSKAVEFLSTLNLKLETTIRLSGTKRKVDFTMKSLSGFVERWIQSLQNPSHCHSAPKLLCKLTRPSGLGSGIHDILYCFVIGLRTGRTVVLDSTRWHRAPGKQWSRTLRTVTGASCVNASLANALTMSPGTGDVVASEIVDLPSAIVEPLVANHGDPYAWWYGQIMTYILRLQDSTRTKIEKFKKVNRYRKPIVGIHVRRRDKIGEAAYHAVEQYMSPVEEFYKNLALTEKVDEKRVYIATDEPNVIVELKKKFPEYAFIFDKATAKEASTFRSREKPGALFAAIRDVFLLAESDFIVCTFSSGFCRIAYELMQTRHSDASTRAASVDMEYFFAYTLFPPRGALYENRAYFPSELNVMKGQSVQKAYCSYCMVQEARKKMYHDGYQEGRLLGSHHHGTFPTYKTVQIYSVARYIAPTKWLEFTSGRNNSYFPLTYVRRGFWGLGLL